MSKVKSLSSTVGILLATIIWGSTFFIIKDSLNQIDAFLLLTLRFGLATTALALVLWWKKTSLFKNFKVGAYLGFLLWIGYVCQTVGLRYTSASSSGFITGLFILFIPLLNFILFQKLPSNKQLFSLLTALAGLWLITGGLSSNNLGDLLTLGSALSFALYIIVVDKSLKKKGDPWLLNFQQFLVVALLSAIVVVVFRLPLAIGNTSTVWAVGYLGIMATFVAFAMQLEAQKHLTLLATSVLLSMEQVFAAIFSWTLGNEMPLPVHVLGGALIVAAAIITQLPDKRSRK